MSEITIAMIGLGLGLTIIWVFFLGYTPSADSRSVSFVRLIWNRTWPQAVLSSVFSAVHFLDRQVD